MRTVTKKCVLILCILTMLENSIPAMAAEKTDLQTEGQMTENNPITDSVAENEYSEKQDEDIDSEEIMENGNKDEDNLIEDLKDDSEDDLEIDGGNTEAVNEPDTTDEELPPLQETPDSVQDLEQNDTADQEGAEDTEESSEQDSSIQTDVVPAPEPETNEIQPDIQELEISEEPKPGEDDPQGGTSMSNQETDSSVSMFSSNAIGTGYIHNDRYNSGYDIINGIDVSRYNGNINWSEVKASGIEYVMIRVGFRGYGSTGSLNEDNMFRQNIEGALDAGLKVGVYFFSQAITRTEAREEANYVLSRISGYDISLPVVIDFEYASGNIGRLYEADLSRDYATQICKAFCRTVEAEGYTGMVYANKSMLESNLYADDISSDYKVWLAHYTTRTDYAGEYYAWQYTSSGRIDGISGNVDCNFFYVKKQVHVNTEDAERYIAHLYENLLERSVDPSGLATYTSALQNGASTAGSVAEALVNSAEFQNKGYSNETYVRKLYLALLGRNAGELEVSEWAGKLDTGVSRTYILAQIVGSVEFQNICTNYKIPQGSIQITENRDKNYSATAYVARCYRTILGRTADISGLNTWTGKILEGNGGAEVVRELLFSQEFQSKKKTDEQVVEILYGTMLNRSSDPGGKLNWLGQLEDGVSYAYIINGFAASSEFNELCREYGILAGKAAITDERDQNIGVTRFVSRIYRTVLGRSGDPEGLNNWCNAILKKAMTPAQAAHGFVFSEECRNRNLDNDDFIEMLYNACLGRSSDPAGKQNWVGQLNAGTTRDTVFWGFANSAEFRGIVAEYGL